jgi:tetratricopeptide (TPR) repeat protein
MRGSKAGRPRRQAGDGNVISIVDEIERRRMEQVRSQASAMHSRELESSFELIDHTAELRRMDLTAELSALAELPAGETRLQRAHLRAARALQSCLNGDPEAGLAEWAEVIAEVPELAHTYLVRARWLMQSDTDAALADYDRAASAEPGDPSAYWRRGDCYLARGDEDRALANYRRALALDPSLFDVHHSMAKIFAARGEHAEAVAAWDRAIAQAPRYVDFYLGRAQALVHLRDFAGAARDHARIVELDPSRSDARFSRAICLHHAGQVDLAIAELARLVELEPDDPHNHRLLGKMRLEKGQWEPAIADLTRAIELSPDEMLSHAHRGRAFWEAGQHDRALADFDRALELAPDDPEVHLGRAKVQASLEDVDAALATTERALALSPDHGLAHVMRAVYQDHLLGPQGFDAVRLDLDRAVELEPGNAAFLRRRAEYLMEHGKYQAALADFERALALSPDTAVLLYGRGHCRSRIPDERGDEDPDYWEEDEEIGPRCRAAIADFERAIALGLCDPEVYTDLWNAHCELRDVEGQRAVLDRGIAALPNCSLLYVLREGLRANSGDPEGAAADHARALELGFRFATN